MTPRRIAYVLNIFPKISETFIAGEIAELRKRGVEICILSLLPPRNEPRHEIVSSAGLDRITNYDVASFGKMVRDFRPQLIHAHFAKEATGKARELSVEFGIPYSFTAHGYDIYRKPPADFYERAMAARAVVTVSEANANYIHATFGVPKSHLHVVSCGVDISFFHPERARRVQTDLPLFVCLARAVEVKNLPLLLEACAILRSRSVSFRCVLAGDGPLHSQLLQLRDKLQLTDIVEMPGVVTQTQALQYWHQAIVGILTSDNEGMPVCLMEAAACGVPVVATAVGGIPELVLNGETGILCERGNAVQIADAIASLLTDAEKRRRIAAAARKRAQERFSIVRQVDELQQIWAEVLARIPA
jgi:glycosyltransferase involved in cell wall biosynthesis